MDTLIRLGHSRIAIIGGDRAISDTSRLRYEGCMQSFTAHGIPFDPKRDYQGVRYSYQAGYQATKALLDKGCRFTAIFATADVMAIGAIRALQDNGLQVPEDVSVMGVDGLPLSSFLVPRLATVRQTVSLLAKRSVEFPASCGRAKSRWRAIMTAAISWRTTGQRNRRRADMFWSWRHLEPAA